MKQPEARPLRVMPRTFLRDMLSNGPKPAKAVSKEAEEAGISERTLDRAKGKLKVESRRGANSWEWVLPAEKRPRTPSTNFGTLERTEAYKQHTYNNLGKDAKSAKDATLERVGTLDGTLQSRPQKTSFLCPDCGSGFETSAGWAKHSVEGCNA